jgi:radical SAM superfamily enzyme YgiQ (UPF0313 family)
VRIGLFALSGVRACDRELLDMGLTMPGTLERSRVIARLPSLGLLTLGGMAGPAHTCTYFEVEEEAALDPLPEGLDLVAMSCLSAQAGAAYRLADRFRARGVPVVMGGLHATALPEEAAAHCDAVVVGEGEACWPQLLRDAESGAGRLQPVYRPAVDFDLGAAPLPAYELLEAGHYHRLTVQVSRGCPYQCDFCASSVLLTPRYKMKPVARVLEEIDRIRTIWPRPFLEFADDNALVHKAYWKRLLTELVPRKLRWFAEADISIHTDLELLDLMRASGCVEVLIGLESPDERGLAGIELKTDWKRRQAATYTEAIARIQQRGIRVNGCFILGLDGHDPGVFDRVLDFATTSELFDVQITILTPFPGTPLYDRLKRAGRLLYDGPAAWERCTLFDVNYVPLQMSPEELRARFRGLVARLYDDERTRWRRETFSKKYLWPLTDAHAQAHAEELRP